MKLREKFKAFKEELIATYKSIVPKETLKFYLDIVDGEGEPFPSEITDIEQVVSELELIDAITELPTIYYNDKNGREREANILEVSESGGIVAYDYDDAEVIYFGFSEINLINDQITLIELITSKVKYKIKVLPVHGQVEEVQEWTLEEILEEINRDRSNDWLDYNEDDWREGWYEWVDGEFYSLIEDIKVGDVVTPTGDSNFTLHCAISRYHVAVVISLEPFVLTSLSADMRWESTVKKEDFRKTDNEINDETLKNCMRRL